MTSTIKLFFLLISFVLLSCWPEESQLPFEDENPSEESCTPLVVDEALFGTAPEDAFEIKRVEVIDGCLEIDVAYGGGCGDAKFKLITSGIVMYSYPAQAHLKLSFKDEDSCEAYVHKTLSYDLSHFKNTGKMVLHLKGWKEGILINE